MAFTAVLQREKIAISIDGRGAWRDNVFVERLWRSVKYEDVYLRAYTIVSEARASIGWYLASTTADARTRHLTAGLPITSTTPDASRSGMKPADASLSNRVELSK